MHNNRTIKHARQDVADTNHALATLRHEARALLGPSGTVPTAAQNTRLDAIERETLALSAKATELTGELAQFERLQDEERAQSTLTQTIAPRGRGRRYAEMFPGRGLDAGGFASSTEFLASIHSGLADQRLHPVYDTGSLRATATGGVPSDGGFSVPEQFFAKWLDSSLENEIVRSRADVRPMASDTAVAPGWDDGDHSSTLFGGFSGEWLGEANDMTPQTAKLRLIQLKARKLGILARVSNELIADGVGFEEQLGQAIIKALGWFLDRAFLAGNGAGAPLGVQTSSATITVSKETAQPAATIVYANLAKMFARMHPSSHGSSVWVCNSTAIPQLLQLSIPIGTSGSHVPVLTESNGQFRILTRPVVFTEKVATLGTLGDIGLYDFSQYVVGLRADFSLAKSSHAGFASDTSYYRGIIRCDGMPKRSAPITPDNGDTQSAFVVLQTRA